MSIIIMSSLLLSIVFAILGVLSLWKKYIYFSDGLAHTALLTATIATLLDLPLIYIGIITTGIFASLVFMFKKLSGKTESTIMVANLMLALALIISSLSPIKINITNLLFGDLIAVNKDDLIVIIILLVITLCFIAFYYRHIILIVLDYDLAKIQGIKAKKIEFLFLTILAFSIFSTMKIVGTLLVTSILLLPAMTARLLANTPIQMLIISIIIALLITILGLASGFFFDLPITPVIIITGVILYLSCYLKFRAC